MKLLRARTRGPRHRLMLRAPGVAAGMGRLIWHVLLTLSFLTSPLAGAAQVSRDEDRYVSRAEYDKLKQKFEQELEALKAQLQGLLEAKAPPKVPSRPEPKQPARAPQVAAKPSQAEQPPGAVSVGDRKKEAEKSKRDLDEFLRRQKVLFRPGEIELEWGVSYSQDTSENACVRVTDSGQPAVGNCFDLTGGLGRVTPTIVTHAAGTSITARYGLAEDVELNVSVPFTFVEQTQDFSPFVERTRRTDDAGLSDISGALRYAVWHEEGSRPEVVVSVSAKSTTGDQDRRLGSGHWDIGGAVTLIKTLDPVVLFGSLGYTAALEGDRVVQGAHVQIDPGDQIPYSVGMGFSLNDRVSVSASLAVTAVRRTSVNGNDRVGSSGDSHALHLSTTVQVAKYVFVEPFVQFGLTADSTDFFAGINVPYRLPVGLRLPFHN